MSIATLIIGPSGTGKSTSMRNIDPASALLIQAIKKPLPFKSAAWKPVTKDNPEGSFFVTDRSDIICRAIQKTKRKIIIIDDWNLIMTNEFFRRSAEQGFQKFSDIGRSAWDVMTAANNAPDDVRVYMLGHTEMNEFGSVKAKTIGKLIDEKCPVESMFSIVLRSDRVDTSYLFHTQTNGQDTCKSPLDMFDSPTVDNDLAMVDMTICEYYGIAQDA